MEYVLCKCSNCDEATFFIENVMIDEYKPTCPYCGKQNDVTVFENIKKKI